MSLLAPRMGTKTAAALLAAGVFLTQHARVSAQGLEFWNTADRSRPWISEINPAAISFQNSQISLGMKAFQVGFLPDNGLGLKENRLNLSLPWLLPFEIGLGADVRYYSAGVYSETSASLLWSRELFHRFAIGFKTGIERRAFSTDNFNIVDPDDPLLAGGLAITNLNFGFGAYWTPGRWELGLGVDKINNPNVGMYSEALLPRQISLAAGYRFGAFIPTVLLHDDGQQWQFGFTVTAVQNRFGRIRLGYETSMPVKVEASLNLSRNNRLEYGMEMARGGARGASAGTHEFIYTHILGRAPEITRPEILFSSYKLEILKEKTVRSMPRTLSKKMLAQSGEVIPKYLSGKGGADKIVVITAGALSASETNDIKWQRYKTLQDRLGRMLRNDPGLGLFIRANKKTISDARAIRRVLVERAYVDAGRIRIIRQKPELKPGLRGFQPGRTTVVHSKPRLSRERLAIRFAVSGKTRKTNGWRFVIRDENNRPVTVFSGKGKLPGGVVWDWRDRSGRLIGPGKYVGWLEVRTTANRMLKSRSRTLAVVQINRTVTLNFSEDNVHGQTPAGAVPPSITEEE